MDTNKIYAESIVNEYSKKEDTKVVKLKKLDRKVKRPANIFAYTFGTLSSLIFGTGMCFSLEVFEVNNKIFMLIGIILGILGIGGCVSNFFIYSKILKASKEKHAGDVIELAKEIVNEGE